MIKITMDDLNSDDYNENLISMFRDLIGNGISFNTLEDFVEFCCSVSLFFEFHLLAQMMLPTDKFRMYRKSLAGYSSYMGNRNIDYPQFIEYRYRVEFEAYMFAIMYWALENPE